ncbi:DUF3043 domain-containing protein [Microbacterium sp. G2-8]|uniref:DUF3043 domain-containing protein n=1 Tax=Microbacterium sp. G2-8 TaxID=2842454 RepID=UPI001C89AE35|nr:DUF3043 domain-containing protein [Microbacterium sp. G2-8]
MAQNASPADGDASKKTPSAGKGRPTPSRAAQEAKRIRPLVATTKEAKLAAKAEMRARQERARSGMANGEERYLGPRDKGPQRRFVREWVDAGWHLGEFLMPMMVLVIVMTFIPTYATQYWSFVALWIFIFFVIGDMILLSMRMKKKVGQKFGEDKREKGLGWYAAMRSIQMRFMRMPKPQNKRGDYPAV